MGKKMANKLPASTGKKRSDDRATVEARPPSPQPSQPTSTPPVSTMIPLDALAAYLAQQDPNRGWAATLAGFNQPGGMPAVPIPTPEIPTTIPTSSNPTPEKTSSTDTTPSTASNPSAIHLQVEPLDINPLSAYQDPDLSEEEEKGSEEEEKGSEEEEKWSEEKRSEEGGDKSGETPVAKPVRTEEKEEKIDLNETARKQGLMTDEEFQSILDDVNRMEIETDRMAEGQDLASQAVRKGGASGVADEPERVVHQPVGEQQPEEKKFEYEESKPLAPESEAEGSDKPTDDQEADVQPKEPEPTIPSVSKPKTDKRKLILKNDPKAEGLKPRMVSQRCLGRWTSSKAGTNTTTDAGEISSEDERTTPTKPGEKPLTATDLEETPISTETISPMPNDQKKNTDKMAEGLDLVSKSVSHKVYMADKAIICVVTKPTTQEESSTATEDEPKEDEDESRYLQERKRKGKFQTKGKKSSKKPPTTSTGIVIQEPKEEELSDSEYASSEVSDSESDVSLEDEDYHEKPLPQDHREVVHPWVERLRYRCWRVELTDELMEDMKRFSTKKLQDAFDDKDESSKQIKSGKVISLPALDELNAREPFLSYIRALGFDWLLENRDQMYT